MENIQGFISTERRPNNNGTTTRYVTFMCPKCGQTVEKVYNKAWFKNLCNHCSKGGYTTAEFVTKCSELHNHKYSYDKTHYVNKRKFVVITCPIHGDFTQRAQEHLNGNGCIRCAQQYRKEANRLSESVWISRLKAYPKLTYVDTSQISGYHDSVYLKCIEHGVFSTQLGDIGQQVHICAECARVAHQSQSIRVEYIGELAYLYYVYLPDIDMYKLGVTIDLETRMRSLGNPKIIKAVQMSYEGACRLEHKLHVALDIYRYRGKQKLIKDGSTELYKTNVYKQIKRALQEKSCIENSLIQGNSQCLIGNGQS